MADEFDLKPTSRGEEFLDVILRSLGGDTPDIPQPAWRYEEYLAAIANAIQNGGGGGSGGGVLVVHVSDGAFDKKYSEILTSTTPVVIHQASEGASYWGFVTAVFDDDGAYTVVVTDSSAQAVSYYIADSEDGYPVVEA